MIPDFEQDFLDMIASLEEASCRYLIVGAFAMAFYGYVRATGDIDFFVSADTDNSVRVFSALKAFGAPLGDVVAGDFEKEGTVFQIGVPPLRIDIITKIDGVSFDEAYDKRKYIRISGHDVPFISLDHLIRNKKSSGREKDIVDVKELELCKIKQ